MATPLTLYVPIKQTPEAQQTAQAIYQGFVNPDHSVLQDSHILHYVRFALVPNLPGTPGYVGLLLITTFDGGMDPYLQYFWNIPSIQETFTNGIEAIALNPPSPPVTDLTGFTNFINANNLNQPQDLYAAYPQSVKQIEAAFGSATASANAATDSATAAGSGSAASAGAGAASASAAGTSANAAS